MLGSVQKGLYFPVLWSKFPSYEGKIWAVLLDIPFPPVIEYSSAS
jgi:hypothetical protein